jgi:hypothetical protein
MSSKGCTAAVRHCAIALILALIVGVSTGADVAQADTGNAANLTMPGSSRKQTRVFRVFPVPNHVWILLYSKFWSSLGLSVAVAIFMILELDRPLGGLIQISSASMRSAIAQLDK